MKRRIRLGAIGFMAGLLLAATGCRSAPPPRPAIPPGLLVLRVSPPGTTVLIDEQPILIAPGATTARVEVPAGAHRIEARAPGHFTVYRDVTVPPRALGEQPLQVALRRDPDAEPEVTTPVRPLGALPSRFPDVP